MKHWRLQSQTDKEKREGARVKNYLGADTVVAHEQVPSERIGGKEGGPPMKNETRPIILA